METIQAVLASAFAIGAFCAGYWMGGRRGATLDSVSESWREFAVAEMQRARSLFEETKAVMEAVDALESRQTEVEKACHSLEKSITRMDETIGNLFLSFRERGAFASPSTAPSRAEFTDDSPGRSIPRAPENAPTPPPSRELRNLTQQWGAGESPTPPEVAVPSGPLRTRASAPPAEHT